MVRLIFDDWSWRCEGCHGMMALPGIVPDINTLESKGWKYCPFCGKRIDYKESRILNEAIRKASEDDDQ